MKLTAAAVIEPKAPIRKAIVAGLKRAGLKVAALDDASGLKREGLLVLGPSVRDGAKVARAAKKANAELLVLAAMSRPGKAAHADAVLPLPVSPRDLMVRLPELALISSLRKKSKPQRSEARVPQSRPGEGILDPLTQFYTFAHFKEVLFIEVKRARRYGFPLSIALLGFDPLPVTMNGELRSQLQAGLALAIRRSLRDTDYPVQYSSDRVLLLMPHTDLPGAMVVSRRIVERVGRAQLSYGKKMLNPTLSAGVAAAAPGKDIGFGELARQANESLTTALSAGGNRVEFFDSVASTPVTDDAPTAQAPVLSES
ncbi:MAG: diguanylate cyclase [Myxococcaceae bacterium]